MYELYNTIKFYGKKNIYILKKLFFSSIFCEYVHKISWILVDIYEYFGYLLVLCAYCEHPKRISFPSIIRVQISKYKHYHPWFELYRGCDPAKGKIPWHTLCGRFTLRVPNNLVLSSGWRSSISFVHFNLIICYYLIKIVLELRQKCKYMNRFFFSTWYNILT